MNRFLIVAMVVVASLGGASNAFGGLVAGWELSGVGGFSEPPLNASELAPELSGFGGAVITRGSGVTTTGSGASNAYGGKGFAADSLSSAITAGDFFTVEFTNNTGDLLSFDSISAYNVRRSSTGPTSGQWQYAIGASPSSWTNIGSTITWGSTTSASGNSQQQIALNGIANLQNVSEALVSFRVVNWGGGSAGTWYFNNSGTGNDFSVNGSFSAVPEPSSLAYGALFVLSTLGIRRRR